MKKQGMESGFEKMRKRSAKRGKARSGFTLVELIVVLALIGLLAAVSVGGMFGYSLYATYKRNNESAKTIFSAAQSAITYYKASGKLEDLRKSVQELGNNPEYVPQDAFAGIDTSEGSDSRKNYDTISYLMMSNEHYDAIKDAVKNGTALDGGVDPQTKLLFELLSDYVTNVDIYNASICVEFDAVDGVVSGVLYCDKDQSFSYGDSSDGINITKRDESYRRRNGLGYYSTELSENVPEKVEGLKVEHARMVNGESLDVQWFLEKKYQYLKGAQEYQIDLYDGDKRLAQIVLDQSSINNIGLVTREAGSRTYVDAKSVTLYAEDGKDYELKGYDKNGAEVPVRFHAYLVQDDSEKNYGSGIALSLDVMDSYLVDAEKLAGNVDTDAYEKALMSTYSARRLSYTDAAGVHYGLNLDGTQMVSAKIIANSYGNGTETTEKENVFFASSPATGQYEIANARHLYNAGFHEQDEARKSSAASAEYRITNSFAWGGPDGLLSIAGEGSSAMGESSAGNTTAKFYHQQEINAISAAAEGERTVYPAFPGIAMLNENSTLKSVAAPEESGEGKKEDEEDGEDGEAGPPWTIDYLTVAAQYDTASSTVSKAGLVLENNGTIENLKLENVDVRGIVPDEGNFYSGEDVGAVCGRNNGTIQNVETVSGYVQGGRNVGGIAGSFSETATVSELKNGAEVSGVENVGGITGALTGSARLENAVNTGITYGWKAPEGSVLTRTDEDMTGETTPTPRYIGGIAGYVENATITESVSNPAPQAGDAEGGVLSAEEVSRRLQGSFVGGIAGYLAGTATIENCSVGAAEGVSSYVLGENFVGGIVGMNAGTNALTGGTAGTCGATVIGRRFVGGIVGVNGALSTEKELSAIDHTDISGSSATVSGWNFTGLAMAENIIQAENTAVYVGGIAGANAGTIENCTASMSGAAAGDLFNSLGGRYADYVGGVAGCNRGSVSGSSVVGSVAGRNYVGGVAGLNDGTANNAVLTNCVTNGITVDGVNFVGGVIGLNTSAALYNGGAEFTWSAAGVSGNSYVGGYAGANIIAPAGEVTIKANGGATQVLAGSAFAGGLFGYNRVVSQEKLGTLLTQSSEGTAVGDVIRMLRDAAQPVAGSAGTDPFMAADTVFQIDAEDSAGSGSLRIQYSMPSSPDAEQVPAVSAQVFAGGVLGYNASQTSLTIEDYTGSVAVTASGSLEAPEQLRKYGDGKKYSFSGGIIGYVTENTILRKCRFEEGSKVTADGATYLGGVAEVNEGTIEECTAASVNADGLRRSNVGGIVGLNGYTAADETGKAQIKKSAAVKVGGNSVVGGVAAENYGKIEGASSTEISASGTDVGGIAGINYSEISDVTEATPIIVGTVNRADANVGGIAGTNASTGTIEKISPQVTVTGGSRAGGFVGWNSGTVLVSDIGGTEHPGQISISASAAANVGGIVGENYGKIDKDTDTEGDAGAAYALVELDLQDSIESPVTIGGIAGRNEGTISNMIYTGKVTGNGNAQNPMSYGGIAGVNAGRGIIEVCKLAAGTTASLDITALGGSYVGGVAGSNVGNAVIRNIVPTTDGEENDNNALQMKITTTNALATGGVVGVNGENASVYGTNSGSNWLIQADGTPGPVGGIIGLHTSASAVRDLRNYAKVTSAGQAAGGIIGQVALDAGTNPGVEVSIQDCVNYASVSAASRAGGILGDWASTASGGIRACENGRRSTPASEPMLDRGDTAATIQAASPATAAGIVGGFSNMGGSQSVNVIACDNFGIIENSFGAGIASLAAETQVITVGNGMPGNPSVTITDCANAGAVSQGGAGITVYNSGKAGNIALTLNRCRNYGRPTEEQEAQFAGLAANVYNGSDGAVALDVNGEQLTSGQMTIKNSIGVAEVKYPTAPKEESANYVDTEVRYGGKDVYYYSAEKSEEAFVPIPIVTAGVGAAVNSENGDYKSGVADAELKSDRSYLKAQNVLDSSGSSTFDPNDESHRQDCRGNYNRLESALAEACLKLERGETVEVGSTPPATDLEAANNGGFLDITWSNQENDDPDEADPGEENPGDNTEESKATGEVYRTVLELRCYDSRDEADSGDIESKDNLVHRATFYGGTTTSYTVRVSESWMGKWIKVSVVNYSYNGTKQVGDIATYILKIRPTLLDPRPEVILDEEGTYALQLVNRDYYKDPEQCILKFTMQMQVEAGETGETTKSSYQKEIGLTQLPYKLSDLFNNGTEGASEGSVEREDEDVRLSFSVQVCPTKVIGSGSSAGEGSAQDSGEEYDPSKKVSLNALIPARNKLAATDGFIQTSENDISREGNNVNFKNLKVRPAVYRAELLGDVVEGNYLLKGIVINSGNQEIASGDAEDADFKALNGRLAIPAEFVDELAHARIYPIEMNGGNAKLGYLIGENLSLRRLFENGILLPSGSQSEAAAAAEQTLDASGAQIGALLSALQTEQTTGTEQTQESASGQESELQTIAETGAGAQKTLETYTVKDGYSVESNGDGTFSVYYCQMLSSASAYHNSVRFWDQQEESSGAAPVSTGGGAGAMIGPASGGGSSGGGSGNGSETESESEIEPITEEETETEPQSETQSETEPQSETQPPTETEAVLLPPQNPMLVPDWDWSIGVNEDGEDNAIAEEEFRDGVTLLVDSVPGAGSYKMRVGFYSGRPALSSGSLQPDPNLLLPDTPGYNFQTEYEITDTGLPIYMFRNLPLSYAGMYMCVQFQSVSSNGQQTSDWSGYIWLQLPRVRLKAPEMTRTLVLEKDTMNVYEEQDDGSGVLQETLNSTEEVELPHVAFTWEQSVPQTDELPKAGDDACGYIIELYRMLEAGVDKESDSYKDPTATVNLMCTDEGYYLERDYTKQEEDDWKEAHKEDGQPLPPYNKLPIYEITKETANDQIKDELEKDPHLSIYECVLNEAMIGHKNYEVTFSQELDDVDGVKRRAEIAELYPRLQIRRYEDETEKVTRTVFTLILPDVEEPQESQNVFLYDYKAAYFTHSVIVQQLLQSVYVEKTVIDGEDVIVADRAHGTYLIDVATVDRGDGSESLRTYQHTLTPGHEYDALTEKEQEDLKTAGLGNWTLLPRSYKTGLCFSTGAAAAYVAAMQTALETDDPANISDIGNELSFTLDLDGNMVQDTESIPVDDGIVPETDGQTIIPGDDQSYDPGYEPDDGIILDESIISTEQLPQSSETQQVSESQPQLPETQQIPEPQTQLPETQQASEQPQLPETQQISEQPQLPETQQASEPQSQLPEPQPQVVEPQTQAWIEPMSAADPVVEIPSEVAEDPGTADGEVVQ